MPLAEPLELALRGRPVTDAVAAVAQVAETLAGLHAEGKVHRDVKPGNLLRHESAAVVSDFGLVHLPDAESLTETGRVPGSFGYIADEVMVDPSKAQNPPTDVYALAKTLWKAAVRDRRLPTPGAAACRRRTALTGAQPDDPATYFAASGTGGVAEPAVRSAHGLAASGLARGRAVCCRSSHLMPGHCLVASDLPHRPGIANLGSTPGGCHGRARSRLIRA